MKKISVFLLVCIVSVVMISCPNGNDPDNSSNVPELQVGQGTDIISNGVAGYQFADRPVNTSSPWVDFTIKNMGTENLTLNGDLVISDTVNFSLTQPDSDTVEPEESIPFSVQFHPGTKGSKTASVTIKSNDPDNPAFYFDIDADAMGDGSLGETDLPGTPYLISSADSITALVVSPDNNFLYGIHFVGSSNYSIIYYDVDSGTGALSNPRTFSDANVNRISSLVMSSDGAYLYGFNDDTPNEGVVWMSRDAGTGALSYEGEITDTDYTPAAVILSHDELSLFVVHNETSGTSGIDWYTRNSVTGALSLKQADAYPDSTIQLINNRLCVSPDDTYIYSVYSEIADPGNKGVCWFSITDGTLEYTDKLPLPDLDFASKIAMSPDGRDLYMTADSTVEANRGFLWLRRNESTGALTYNDRYTDSAIKDFSQDCFVSTDGFNVYFCTRGSDATANIVWFTRDKDDGSLSGIGSVDLPSDSHISFDIQPIPELNVIYVAGKTTDPDGFINIFERDY